ncbi:MAG: ATP-binding protein, partial [Pseudomonadota bacterium]|nr:ATP-binding protein [Pseudomonadota bacterium]
MLVPADPPAEAAHRAEALLAEARRYFVEGRYAETLAFCDEAAVLFAVAEDARGAGVAANLAGSVFLERAAYEEALGRFLIAHERGEEAGDLDGVARSRTNLGLVHWRLGDLPRARADFDAALRYFEGTDDGRAFGNILNCMGLVAEDEGKPDEARAWYHRARVALEAADDPVFLANVLANLADLHETGGDTATAWAYAEASLALRTANGHARGVVGSRVSLARLALARGDAARAAREVAAGLEGAVGLGLRKQHADLLELGARIVAAAGAWERAYRLRGEGAELRQSLVGEELARRVAEQRARLDVREARRLVEVRDRENDLLRAANAAAEAASRAKSTFVAVMSHEIRTPLTTTLGAMELLRATTLAPRQRELVDAAQGSARTLLALVEDVLDLSRIEAGRLDLDIRPMDLSALLEPLVAGVRVSTEEKGLRFVVARAPDLRVRGLGDPERLVQVLLNLLTNAVKFTAQGEVRLEVDNGGATGDDDATVRFTVADTGIGIVPEMVERIFEPFVQADSSMTRRYGGTGLGLSIARRLTEAMGGTLDVVSASGAGATFTFTVPFPRDPAPLDALTEAAPPTPRAPPGLRVLFVEDDDLVAEILGAMLLHLGCVATRATCGADALARVDATPFPLVFMDVHMPGMDGFALATELRARHGAAMRLVGLSGAATPSDGARARGAGMDDYLTKPVTLDRLRAALAAHGPGARSGTGADGAPGGPANEAPRTRCADYWLAVAGAVDALPGAASGSTGGSPGASGAGGV